MINILKTIQNAFWVLMEKISKKVKQDFLKIC